MDKRDMRNQRMVGADGMEERDGGNGWDGGGGRLNAVARSSPMPVNTYWHSGCYARYLLHYPATTVPTLMPAKTCWHVGCTVVTGSIVRAGLYPNSFTPTASPPYPPAIPLFDYKECWLLPAVFLGGASMGAKPYSSRPPSG